MTENQILIELSAILSLGLAASLLASRLKAPSILFLLLAGLIAGPMTGFIRPQEILGPLVKPIVSLCTAIILFEGGMWLRMSELKQLSKAIGALVFGASFITLTLTTLAVHYLLDMNWMLSLFLGSILIVTGPTVIGPMLQQIRPRGAVAALLKWEGIVVDLIGTLFVVLIFEILTSDPTQAPLEVMWALTKTFLMGVSVGFFGGKSLAHILRAGWIPHRLHNAAVLLFVIVGFVLSNYVQHDSGLLAAAIMGFVLINTEDLALGHIVEFKENLQVLLIPLVFIILSARLPKYYLESISWNDLIFPLLLIVVIRPVSVVLATIKSKLAWNERLFIAGLAPRGIIAAAITSFFSLELELIGFPGAERLVQIVFGVILCTVTFYGLTAGPWARFLKLAETNPQGILLLGAENIAVQFALALQKIGLKIQIIDTNPQHVANAQNLGLNAINYNILSPEVLRRIDLSGIGKFIAFTSNDEVNTMSAILFAPILGSQNVFQLSLGKNSNRKAGQAIGGLELFSPGVTADYLSLALQDDAKFSVLPADQENGATRITSDMTPEIKVPLALLHEDGKVDFLTTSSAPLAGSKDQWLVLTRPNITGQQTT